MHYYSHHIGDFIKDTSNLSDAQCMAYLRLVWKYYSDEEPISGEFEDIAFSIGSDETTVRLLLKHYFTQDGELWRQKRIDKELEAFRAKSEKAKASVKARWDKQKQNEGNTNGLRTYNERKTNEPLLDTNQEPITNNHKPITKLKETFAQFWAEYPKKKSKGTAEKAWNKLNPDEQLVSKILSALKRAKTQEDWIKQDGQFIPHPATWLNGKCWEDEDNQPPEAPKIKPLVNEK